MTIKPIETWYAGCRFRSRLEARWAVALDELGITWEYEAQGYKLPSGARYLPDFWLPDQQAHIEVKGSEDAFLAEAPRYAEAIQTSALPGYELIILGPIPDPDTRHYAYALAMDLRDIHGDKVLCLHATDLGTIIKPGSPAHTAGERSNSFSAFCTDIQSYTIGEPPPLSSKKKANTSWTRGVTWPEEPNNPKVRAAYTAARSARFERGAK